MLKTYNVTYEATVTVRAQSAEEARDLVEDGEGENRRRVWILEVDEEDDT